MLQPLYCKQCWLAQFDLVVVQVCMRKVLMANFQCFTAARHLLPGLGTLRATCDAHQMQVRH